MFLSLHVAALLFAIVRFVFSVGEPKGTPTGVLLNYVALFAFIFGLTGLIQFFL